MQMAACLPYLFSMKTSQFNFVTASPFGIRIILLEIRLYVIPRKMQANNFKLLPYFKYTDIN